MFLEKALDFGMPYIGYCCIMQWNVEKSRHLEITIHNLKICNEQEKIKIPFNHTTFLF
jgi:hypothetical protein